MRSRYWKRTHTFGRRIPKSVEEALALDHENGNTLWQDAIHKEMKNFMPAFKFLDPETPAPIGYLKIPCHIFI